MKNGFVLQVYMAIIAKKCQYFVCKIYFKNQKFRKNKVIASFL